MFAVGDAWNVPDLPLEGQQVPATLLAEYF
jgi:hypothetical protein